MVVAVCRGSGRGKDEGHSIRLLLLNDEMLSGGGRWWLRCLGSSYDLWLLCGNGQRLVETGQHRVGGFGQSSGALEFILESNSLVDDIGQAVGSARISPCTSAAVPLSRCRLIVGCIDLHLVLHPIVDRSELDVLAETLVALQQEPELDILDRVLPVPAPRTQGL